MNEKNICRFQNKKLVYGMSVKFYSKKKRDYLNRKIQINNGKLVVEEMLMAK